MQIQINKKGITLISLIITIIILVILSAITLNIVLGDNAIIRKTQEAKEETEKQTATDIMNLKITDIQISSYAENQDLPTLQYLADRLCEDNDMEYVLKESKNYASLNKIDVTDVSSIFTKLKKYPYEFEIDSSLRLASINGVQIASSEDNSEKIQEMQEQINSLQSQLAELQQENDKLKEIKKNVTFISDDRATCSIPSGVTEAYVFFAHATDMDPFNVFNVSGSIVENTSIITSNSYVDYGPSSKAIRESICIVKVQLTGEEGTIQMSVSGGSAARMAWSTIVMY